MLELIPKPANDPNAQKRVPFGAADEVRNLDFYISRALSSPKGDMLELILKPANDPNAQKRVPFGAADKVRVLRRRPHMCDEVRIARALVREYY